MPMNWEQLLCTERLGGRHIALAAGLMLSLSAQAFERPGQQVQFLVGSARLSDAWVMEDERGRPYRTGLAPLRSFGLVLQEPYGAGVFQYGLEGALYVSYENNRRVFVRVGNGSGEARIEIDSDFWLSETSLGGFVALRPVPGLRFYAGAGPSLYWGYLHHGGSEDDDGSYSRIVIGNRVVDTRTSSNRLGLALYGRVGAELEFPRGATLGMALRQSTTELDFGRRGRIDLRQPQWMFSIGRRF